MRLTRRAFLDLAAAAVALPVGLRSARPQDVFQEWPTEGWRASSPEEQGMDSNALARLIDFGAARGMDSLLVTRHGKIVTEVYYAPFRAGIKHRMNSATKAVVGTLTAIAWKNGLLDSLDHKALGFFADRTIVNLDERKKAITIQSLLDMTSGLDWTERLDGSKPESFFSMERSPDWQQFILDRPMSQAPGADFNYNSGNAHLLSAILTRITGLSALDYAKQELFGPLGITDIFWRNDPQGISAGGAGLYLQPRDMAKIGYLYLRNGFWRGQRLLPAGWMDKVNHASVDMHLSREPRLWYTNLFWAIPTDGVYIAVGHHRQLIVVMPALDIVAVTTGTRAYSYHRLVEAIAGSVRADAPLPSNSAALDLLAGRIEHVATERPTPVRAASGIAKSISGKVYHFATNARHLEWLSLNLSGENPSYEYRYDTDAPTQRFSGPIGLEGLYRIGGQRRFGINAAKGAWLDDKTFAIEHQTLGNDDAGRVILSFEGRGVAVTFEGADGKSTAYGETAD